MASMFKQNLLKAGRDFNYSMAVKIVAGLPIAEGQVLYPSGSQGTFLVYTPSTGSAATTTTGGRLLIAKHAVPK